MSTDQKAYDDAALSELWGKIPFLNGVLGDVSAAETARVRQKIAAKRAWANGLTDQKWRDAFNRWLEHADYCCDKADRYREEMPAKSARWEKQRAERSALRTGSRKLLAENPPR